MHKVTLPQELMSKLKMSVVGHCSAANYYHAMHIVQCTVLMC